MNQLKFHLLVIKVDLPFLNQLEASLADYVDEFSSASSVQDGISILLRDPANLVLVGGQDCLQTSTELLSVIPTQSIICVFPRDVPGNAYDEGNRIGVKAVVSEPLNIHYLQTLLKAISVPQHAD